MVDYLKYKDIAKSLEIKGFTENADTWSFGSGNSIIATCIIAINELKVLEDLDPKSLKKVLESLYLNREQFKALIECPLTKEEYRKILDKKMSGI